MPAFNEERHVGAVIESMPAFVDEVVVVDDGSSDGTRDVVERMARDNVRLISHDRNLGVGAAVVTGYRAALQDGADVVALMGGDDQMDPAHLTRLLDPVVEGRCDFAKGNRFFSRHSLRGMPRHRAFGNVALTLLTKVASGYWRLFDSQNGYTAVSAGMLRRLPLGRLEKGYQFENLLLVELRIAGARLLDMPIPARYGEEVSGIRVWRVGPTILAALWTGFWRRVRASYLSPPSLAGIALIAGLVLLIGGLVAAVWPSGPGGLGGLMLAGGGLSLALFVAADVVSSPRPGAVRESRVVGPRSVSTARSARRAP